MKNVYIHPSADVQSQFLGKGTKVWQYVVILPDAKIGSNVNICSHCLIENKVAIGDRVTIKSGVQIWDGIKIEDDVFIGPNVTFANDYFPRSKKFLSKPIETLIQEGASIGSNASILPGVSIGPKSIIGAGAVVTKSVPAHSIVVGNPARIVGYTDETNLKIQQKSTLDQSIQKIKSKVKGVVFTKIKNVEDIRGDLSVCEFAKDLPFMPSRYFLVYDVPSVEIRGQHSHIKCHQFLVAVKGTVHVLVDDGKNKELFILNKNHNGLYIPPKTWAVQYNYSSDAVLFVLASHPYNEKDYVRDYEAFLKSKK